MAKIFPLRPRRLKPQQQRPMFQPDACLSARIAQDWREVERIAADRARRSAERRAAAIALQTRRAAEASTNASLEDWSDRDAAWFVAHPGRNHRVRRAVEGEFMAGDQRSRWTAIRQVAPGIRVRLPLDVPYRARRFVEWAAAEEGAVLIFEMAACNLGAESILAAFGKASPVHPSAGDA